MSHIGMFQRQQNGFAGRIDTLLVTKDITLEIAEVRNSENAPDYRVHAGDTDGPEIGAGWKRTGERAGDYVAIIIDDPLLPQPIRANLFRDSADGASWSLHWNRTDKAGGKR